MDKVGPPQNLTFVKGNRYRVRYRLETQRRDREMVASYLGYDRTRNEFMFNLRPLAGTTALSGRDIHSAVETDEPKIIERLV